MGLNILLFRLLTIGKTLKLSRFGVYNGPANIFKKKVYLHEEIIS